MGREKPTYANTQARPRNYMRHTHLKPVVVDGQRAGACRCAQAEQWVWRGGWPRTRRRRCGALRRPLHLEAFRSCVAAKEQIASPVAVLCGEITRHAGLKAGAVRVGAHVRAVALVRATIGVPAVHSGQGLLQAPGLVEQDRMVCTIGARLPWLDAVFPQPPTEDVLGGRVQCAVEGVAWHLGAGASRTVHTDTSLCYCRPSVHQ